MRQSFGSDQRSLITAHGASTGHTTSMWPDTIDDFSDRNIKEPPTKEDAGGTQRTVKTVPLCASTKRHNRPLRQ